MSLPQFSSVLNEKRGKIAVITLSRPEKKNALDKTLRSELIQTLNSLEHDPKTQSAVLFGGTEVFCAGFDKNEVIGLIQKGNAQDAQTFAEETIRFQEAVLTFPKVLIAAIGGPALGGGCDLAVVCHLRIAADNALFGHPEIGFGACPLFFPYYGLMGRGKIITSKTGEKTGEKKKKWAIIPVKWVKDLLSNTRKFSGYCWWREPE